MIATGFVTLAGPDEATPPTRFEAGYVDISIGGSFTGTITLQKFVQDWVKVEEWTEPDQNVFIQANRDIDWRLIFTDYIAGSAIVRLSQNV